MGQEQCKPCPPVVSTNSLVMTAEPPSAQGRGWTVNDPERSGIETDYSDADLAGLLARFKQHLGPVERPMPANSRYSLSFAPSMRQFWASDPKRKRYRSKPLVMNGESPAQLAMEHYLQRKGAAWPEVEPGRFNMTPFGVERGLVADALARAHKDYASLVNSRPKSGPVAIVQCR